MAKIIRRTWTSVGPLGRKVRHVAFGYDVRVQGQRERKWSAEWPTEQAAMTALTDRLQAVQAGQLDRPAERALGVLVEEYLTYKRDKRSLKDDERILKRLLLPTFGAATPVRRLDGATIAQYERTRAGQVSASTVANELSVLRHCLRLARRWGYVATVPEIVLPKRPEGRLRYLDEGEIATLIAACRESRNRYLAPIVTLALHTGMRKGELLGLEWERVDLSTARITLLQTKSGRPRGVPIGRAVYDTLIALEPDAERRRGHLFPNGNDRRGSQIRAAFEAALSRAGIVGFRFHDLRHTAASHLVMRGGEPPGREGGPRARGPPDDAPVCPPQPGPPPGRGGASGRTDGGNHGACRHRGRFVGNDGNDRGREASRLMLKLKLVGLALILTGAAFVVYHGSYVLTIIGIAPAPDETRTMLALGVVLLIAGILLYGSRRAGT